MNASSLLLLQIVQASGLKGVAELPGRLLISGALIKRRGDE